jgi:hypothetical protein
LAHGEHAAQAPGKTRGNHEVKGGQGEHVASGLLRLLVSHSGFHQKKLAFSGTARKYWKRLPNQLAPCSKQALKGTIFLGQSGQDGNAYHMENLMKPRWIAEWCRISLTLPANSLG